MACWRRSCSRCSCSASDKQLEFNMQDDSMTSPSEIQPSTWHRRMWRNHCPGRPGLPWMCRCVLLPVWPGSAGASAAGSAPGVCACCRRSAAAPSVCPAGGAAAPPLERRGRPLPPTARYLRRAQVSKSGHFGFSVPHQDSKACLCCSLFMCVLHECMYFLVNVSPCQIQYAGFYGHQLCASESSFHGNPIPLFPLPSLSSLPPFPLSVLLNWSGWCCTVGQVPHLFCSFDDDHDSFDQIWQTVLNHKLICFLPVCLCLGVWCHWGPLGGPQAKPNHSQVQLQASK